MKVALALLALAGACALAGCNEEDAGWYATMTCQQRDLARGWCTQATYSCPSEQQQVVYYTVGPRCFLRGAR